MSDAMASLDYLVQGVPYIVGGLGAAVLGQQDCRTRPRGLAPHDFARNGLEASHIAEV